MILVIDNYDSFTYNLVQLLAALGAEVEVRRNDEISASEAMALEPRGVVISPGPGTPADAGVSGRVVRAATEAGCRFVIDSDAHERSEWRYLVWGTAVARRGWLTPELVANTLPRDDFVALMREKPHRV